MVDIEVDIGILSWVLPLVIGTAVPFIVIVLQRASQHKDSSIAEKMKLEEVATMAKSLAITVKERFDKLDIELRLREDEYRKDAVDVKTKLEFLSSKMQLAEYRLDKINGVKK